MADFSSLLCCSGSIRIEYPQSSPDFITTFEFFSISSNLFRSLQNCGLILRSRFQHSFIIRYISSLQKSGNDKRNPKLRNFLTCAEFSNSWYGSSQCVKSSHKTTPVNCLIYFEPFKKAWLHTTLTI